METFSITLFLFVLLGSAYCQLPDPCQIATVQSCRNPSTEFAISHMNGYLPDAAFLKENCDAVNGQIDCFLEHEKTCPLPDMFLTGPQQRFRGFQGLKKLVVDICDEDSSLRKDYLQSVCCIEGHVNEIKENFMEMDSMINRFNRHYLMENEENSIDDDTAQCVKYAFVFNGVKNTLEKHCGPVASDAFVAIVNHIAINEPDLCLGDQENFDRLNELLESFRPSEDLESFRPSEDLESFSPTEDLESFGSSEEDFNFNSIE